MFTDPLAVTYDGSAKSLARIAQQRGSTVYRTADGEFEVTISSDPQLGNGVRSTMIVLGRRLPDPTPGDAFDAFREIRNSFGCFYAYDAFTRAEASVDIPKLRTALLSLIDTSFQARLIAGEK